jgi:hypothetical protein
MGKHKIGIMNEQVLNRIFNFFVDSRDFNGIALLAMMEEFELNVDDAVDLLKELVIENKISLQSSTNPHIIYNKHYPVDSQIKILDEARKIEIVPFEMGSFEFKHFNTDTPICLYPSQDLLISRRDVSVIKDLPYTLQLALAEPHLKPIFFEIEVLYRYFNDPRYDFRFDDYSGSISNKYDENDKPILREEDQTFLKTFGLGFDGDNNRLAVVYLRYLSDLTREHQIFWKSKESKREGKILSEYYENTILGRRTSSYSNFTGLLTELSLLNKLSVLLFDKNLFHKDFDKDNRPKEFTFFFSPTLKNYNAFILLLDKMISENINKDFFIGKVDLFEFKNISDGVVERKEKGTLALFEEWLLSQFHIGEVDELKALFIPLKKIRRERQTPAHKIDVNVYDPKYSDMQKKWMGDAYKSINALRLIFQQHPKAKEYEIPKWFERGKVKSF